VARSIDWRIKNVFIVAKRNTSMSFRIKLLLIFAVTVAAAVGLVAWGVSTTTRRAFERLDEQRTAALVAQFQREFAARGEEVVRKVSGIADAEATTRMAIELSSQKADPSAYLDDATGLAKSYQLNFLELAGNDGARISSAQWPARFGYKNEWVTAEKNWNAQGAFLRREELPDNVALALTAVRTVPVGGKNLYIIGGARLNKGFLASLVLPAGMRALLYSNLEPAFVAEALTDASGPVKQAERLQPLVDAVRKSSPGSPPIVQTLTWTTDPASAETFHAIPLRGRRDELLGVLLVGSSRHDLVTLSQTIRNLALGVGGGAMALCLILGWWVSARVTRPLEQLAAGARAVAAGDWTTRVETRGRDEVGQLAGAFNEMIRQLAEQRERLVQVERVAAWRELARRLAHELKNPLFPLQITVENLQRAREGSPEQFDEVFRESTAALRAELANLNAIVGRFSDFARMPTPHLQNVDMNEAVRAAVRLFEPQFSAVGRPPITTEFFLTPVLPEIQADPELLHRALQNLVLNAMDAMAAGGTLTLRTQAHDSVVRVEVSDTGAGLTREECERLFTPYYTSKQHGTGLGLAIVQSVVSDHGGKISVESEPGHGTTFRIELPVVPPAPAAESSDAKV
jgi:two-component system nitrogen regulation sensor histidine kinase NtrY